MTRRARFRRRHGVNPPDVPRTHRRTAHARLMGAAYVAVANTGGPRIIQHGPIRNTGQLTAAGLPSRGW